MPFVIRKRSAGKNGILSIGHAVRNRCSVIWNGNLFSDPDHQPIGQTGDGEQGGADKSLMHADLIRTGRRDDGNAARTDTDGIRGTGIPGDLKGIFGGHRIQTDGLQ